MRFLCNNSNDLLGVTECSKTQELKKLISSGALRLS